jgi:hypothetical protein
LGRPLPEPILFVDVCLGATDVPNALREAGIQYELLRDRYPPGTPDEVWLKEVGQRGLVVITKDRQIRHRRTELKALQEAKVAAFVLTSGQLTGVAMGRAFVLAYPRIRKLLRDYEVPLLASISAAGKVSLLVEQAKRGGRRKG